MGSDFNMKNMVYMMHHKNPDKDKEEVQEFI